MNRPELIDAFNECIAWLQAGASVEACLQRYPALADELRPLLETARDVSRARAGAMEVQRAQTRVRARVMRELTRAPVAPAQRLWSRGLAQLAVAAALVLVLAALFAGREPILSLLQGSTPTPSLVITLTPAESPAPELPTASPTATVTASATQTATQPIAATQTPTMTQTATQIATQTATLQGACVASQPDDWVAYEVQSGDTLSRLASLSGLTVEDLQGVNCLEDSLIVVGETLYVPEAALSSLASPPPSGGAAGSGGTSNDNSAPSGGGVDDNSNDNDDDDDAENEAESEHDDD